jgi:hypothetical protein
LKLGKSATETLEILREAFGEHSLTRTTVFEWAVGCQLKITNVHDDQAPAERQKMLKIFEKSSTKTVAEKSTRSETALGSGTKFARRYYRNLNMYRIAPTLDK